MLDNEQTVAGGGEAASANSKKLNMLFLAGMILAAAAYLSPFNIGVYIREYSNVSKGTVGHSFGMPSLFLGLKR